MNDEPSRRLVDRHSVAAHRRHQPLLMKRLAFLSLLMLVSCAATMRVTGTAPSKDNDGTCAAPALVTNVSTSVVVHFEWSGPESGQDSLSAATGSPFVFTRQTKAGTYNIRAWVSDVGGVGCDTTITRTYRSPPHKPGVN